MLPVFETIVAHLRSLAAENDARRYFRAGGMRLERRHAVTKRKVGIRRSRNLSLPRIDAINLRMLALGLSRFRRLYARFRHKVTIVATELNLRRVARVDPFDWEARW